MKNSHQSTPKVAHFEMSCRGHRGTELREISRGEVRRQLASRARNVEESIESLIRSPFAWLEGEDGLIRFVPEQKSEEQLNSTSST